MKFEIVDSSFWIDGNQLLKRYPNLSTLGKYYIDKNKQLIIESNDFSVVEKILTTVYKKIIIDTNTDYDYRIIICDGIEILDCEDCVHYSSEILDCEPCNKCYGFEYYIDKNTNSNRDEMKSNKN